ncbi:Hypothetical_protein [Hexamita inflata]|uniref:Hypothetical_protein n=1 Tax=Hexamita inflata TaxID=28002 RepID=A0AA86U1C1_9EUKA|nr:Hypothetical protein HINF_LOCUS24179 [Hexamita inflata]
MIYLYFSFIIFTVLESDRVLSIQLQCLLHYIKNISNDKLNSTFDRGIDGIAALLGVINNGCIRLCFSFLAASNLLRCGQIGCGRQNPPVQSSELPSRIGMAKGMLQMSSRIGKWNCFLKVYIFSSLSYTTQDFMSSVISVQNNI